MVAKAKGVRAAARQQVADASPAELRALTSALLARSDFAEIAGRSFRGKRDIYSALGYKTKLMPIDYRGRYNRGGLAKRLVDAFPMSTWRGGGELVENDDPNVETAFEKAFHELNQRLNVWATFQKADILAGLGRFSVILLGGPGKFDEPLERCTPDDLKYLSPFSERDITIQAYVLDQNDARYGQGEYYTLSARRMNADGRTGASIPSRIHWTRIIHSAEGLLDDPLFGTPRLQAVWNYLDDLDKVVGGGAEASWKRIDGGKQFNLDPNMPVPLQTDLDALKEKIDLYTNDLERVLTTRGVEIKDLGSNVSIFSQNADAIISLISATTGIPQRILMGSERGELASSTDQSNYDDRVEDRRHDFAWTQLVKPFTDRMIKLGVLPTPKQYEARWPEVDKLDDDGRMQLAERASKVNQQQGETVITVNEIRDRCLGYPPIEEVAPEERDEEPVISVEDDEELLRVAARSAVKRVRLLRLTRQGRQQLRKGVKAE